MPGTEPEQTTRSKLSLITKRAREEPRFRFTSLAHLLDEGFLRACYHELGRDRAGGMDGVTWKDYGKDLDENLKGLVVRLKSKRYKPLPARRVYIPKEGGTERPLGLPSLEDKIVQRGMAAIMEAIYETDFLNCSYGFRPGRSCHQAINAVDKTIMTKPVNHVVDVDIKGFFDNVSHEWMIRFLGVRINDPSFLLLVGKFLKAGYVEAGMIVETERGTPQGGNLSPILANVYLHYVIDLWFERKLKRRVYGQSYLVRYADDVICMVQGADDARVIRQALTERLAAFELEMHPEKTRVISFGRYEEGNAKRQNRKPNTFDFLGFTHYCTKGRRGGFTVGRKTSGKKFRMKCREMNTWLKSVRNTAKAKEWWPTLAAKLRGHYQYYGVSGNMRSIRRFYFVTLRLTLKWLNRRSQRRSFNWEGFNEYLKRYPIPSPHITHNLFTLSPVT